MFFFKEYEQKVVKYDLINKFKYKSIKNIPKLTYISLYFKLKNFDSKKLISALASLEVLTLQKSTLLKSKVSNVSLKIRKGLPIGCKVTLRKNNRNRFLFKLLNKILLKSEIKNSTNSIFFKLTNMLVFSELEKNYQFFKNLTDLHIQIKTTQCSKNEFKFLINSYKL